MGDGYALQSIIIDTEVAGSPLAQRILSRWQGAPPQFTDNVAGVVEQARRQADATESGKRTLLVSRRKGPFLTMCQGMTERHRACCAYRILNVIENCPMDCAYCILQGYLDNPLVVLNANLDDLAAEVGQVANLSRPRKRSGHPRPSGQADSLSYVRLGTGELGDSLAFDRLTGLSLDLMDIVAPHRNLVLELKTKTAEIENLLSVPAPPNVLISWSLNTARHIASEEIGTASLDKRLAAAQRCQEHGYRLGFHFDPLIWSSGWEEEYRGVVERLFDHIDASQIVWISLGGLRYPPAMKAVIEQRFRRSAITGGELVPSWDGKLRYFRPIRVAMYRRMAEWIAARAPDLVVYLCMESPEIWRGVFGWSPGGVIEVAERLDAGCRKAEFAGGAVRVAD